MTRPITLYTFGPFFGVPDPSPFVLKTITLMKMSGLLFVEDRTGFNKAPKGKLPYIDDNGTIVADSTLIRRHLERVHGIDFDWELTAEQKATGWALERTLENHAYWLVLHERWMDDGNFARGPRHFFDEVPSPIRSVVIALVRRKLKRSLYLHGIGRHGEADRLMMAAGDFEAMAGLLGDKPYLFGDTPHGADATLFAFATQVLCTDIQPKLTALAAPHANLRAYVDRMMTRYFPDFART